MMSLSLPELLEILSTGPVLTPAQRDELRAAGPGAHADAASLLRDLVRRGWLTPFQANRLLSGGADLVLGPYVLLDQLGAGGLGAVFRARHTALDRVVALKVLAPHMRREPDTARRFLSETASLARLAHPNLVMVHSAGEERGALYLALQLVEGPDLDRLVRRQGPLDPALACEYVRQAALGLQHAHEHGLLHRAMKPASLLLDGTGRVLVADLGLAGLAEPGPQEYGLTASGTVLGTPDFMAPEQISSDLAAVDARTDVYALGATLYFLLTGAGMAPAGSVMQSLHRLMTGAVVPLESVRPGLPPAVLAVVSRMTARRPADRFATAAEVAAALAPLARGPLARGPADPSPARPQSDRPSRAATVNRLGPGDQPGLADDWPTARLPPVPPETDRTPGGGPGWPWRGLLLAAGFLLVVLVVGLLLALRPGPDPAAPPDAPGVTAGAR